MVALKDQIMWWVGVSRCQFNLAKHQTGNDLLLSASLLLLMCCNWPIRPLTPILCVQEFPLSGSWTERGSERAGGGLRHRHSGRRGCEGHSSAAEAICGHDPHPDFRWGLGSLRAHCRPHLVHKIIIHNVSTARSILCCCWRKKCGGKIV